MRIIIPGGSGQVGRILARHFHAKSQTVTVLSRSPRPEPWRMMRWDGLTPGAWVSELEQSDVCINLAGRSVNCRYDAENRRAIYESRIQSTVLLNQVIASLNQPPRLWVNASTATIYRHALDRQMDEATGELAGNEPGAPNTGTSPSMLRKHGRKLSSQSPPAHPQDRTRSAITFSPDREVESLMCSWVSFAGALAAGKVSVPSMFRGFTKPISCG